MPKYLSDKLVALFWLLPYSARRSLYRLLRPSAFDVYQAMRSLDEDGQNSLKPFDRLECIFIHIPKCAGISVGRSLFGYTPGSHISILTYQLIYSEEEFNNYFKFTFTRNPWDRLVSAYKFLKAGGLAEEDRLWAEENLSEYHDFETFVEEWVTPSNVLTWQHFKPQTRYIYSPTGELLVDFMGRVERLPEDFAVVAEKLGVEGELLHMNKSPRKKSDYRSFYSEKTKQIVAEVYQEDIERLGYNFDGLV